MLRACASLDDRRGWRSAFGTGKDLRDEWAANFEPAGWQKFQIIDRLAVVGQAGCKRSFQR